MLATSEARAAARIVAAGLITLIIGFTLAGPAAAQDATEAADGMIVERVDFVGVESLSEGYLRRVVKTRATQPFSRNQLEQDVRALLQTRKFINAYAETTVEQGRVIVTFNVAEKPELETVELRGNFRFDDNDLYVLLPSPGDPIDSFLIERGRDEIIRKYKEAGYYYIEVGIDQQLLEQEGRLIYQITEGVRVKVRKIRFEGMYAFRDDALRAKIETKTYIWVFRTGALDEEQLDLDAVTLEEHYRSEAYLDARVGYRLEFDEVDRRNVDVVFVVDEGPRYQIDEIAVSGNEAFSTEKLLGEMSLAPDMYLRDEVLQRDIRTIRDLYGEIGFVEVRVDTTYDYLDAPERVRLRYTIDEGRRSKVGRITIRGNVDTKDYVIRRALRFYPGEDYNTVKAREAEQRLRETALFSSATVTPLQDINGTREAVVEVAETDAILFLIGVGVSTDAGVLGSISLTNRNFDLFDWPRTWGHLFRGQAFRGAGQTLRFQAEPGTELSRFRVDFTEPYLMHRPVRLSTSLYLWERGRGAYDEERYGGTVSLGRRFESGPLDGWAVEGALRLEGVGISEIEPFSAREIRDVKGNHVLTALKGTVVRDTTDSRFLPTRGYRLNFSWEQVGALGGDHLFAKPSVGASWYKTLHTDLLDRKSVLAVRGDVAYIVGDAPTFERFYAGGFGSLRGFSFRGVSPRNGIRDDAIGGDFIVLSGAEYSFPVYGRTIRGVTFLDMGTVEDGIGISTWRAAVGFGLRITVDFFGPVPMVLDFSFPIAEDEKDDTQLFNFSFGASF